MEMKGGLDKLSTLTGFIVECISLKLPLTVKNALKHRICKVHKT